MTIARCAFLLVFTCACADTGVVGRICPRGKCDAGAEQEPDARVSMDPAGGSCANGVVALSQRRLDVYLMIDDSSSMLVLWSWANTIAAIEAFLRDPSSAGMGVGLQFFGTSCEVAAYSTPLVPIAPLPDNASQLVAAFPFVPLDETATLPAMQGAVAHAKAWATQHPERDVAVWLITDGLPDECESTVENVAQVAREANQGRPSIPTYVIVLGPIGALNVFASAGGTGDAKIVTEDSVPALQMALSEVRDAAKRCAFSWPQELVGRYDADLVEVVRESSDGTRTPLPALSDESGCDAARGGYYFHEATAAVVVCPAYCRALGSDRLIATARCSNSARN